MANEATKFTMADGTDVDITDHRIILADMGTVTPSSGNINVTKTINGVTDSMVVANAILGTPSNQTGTWIVTTDTNSVTVTGPCSAATTLKILLMEPQSS